ncbi:MAG: hypothetical protein A3K61_05180 [Thaumarchaeota archaeon RBG_16_49_8]|nr:MAG: hypothetical protein A3K61_05180 [Thaumarchaeota archaeon RBG_16_49_8]
MNNFENILVNSARSGLRKLLGDSPAATIDFYCDSSMLAEDPHRYEKELENMFGIGANVLREAVLNELHMQLGLQRLKKIRKNFADEILEVRREYHSRNNSNLAS